MLEEVGTAGSSADVVVRKDKQEANNKNCLFELHGALPQVVYYYIRSSKTTKETGDTLKEKKIKEIKKQRKAL